MSGNKACRVWVEKARSLDIKWIVLQHGSFFKGKEMVSEFLDGFENLECGLDLQ